MALIDKLKAIADGFRASRGTTKEYSLDEMAVLAAEKVGGGGPLQAKTAYPSHSEQVIAPDEDYYGLVSVTVKPVPKLPACAVEIKTPSGVEYYYNHEQLPEIPADVVENYPYIVIFHNFSTTFRMFATKTKPYTRTQEDGTFVLYFPGGFVRYNYNVDADAWVINSTGQNIVYDMHGASWWTVWWSNYDVPNGSPDAEEIYFPASQPQEEQPADATHYYYNGVRLPVIPADVLASYPYVLIAKGIETGPIRIYGSTTTTYHRGADDNRIYISANRVRLTLDQSAMVWGEAEAETTATNLNLDTTWEILWSNHDIPNGSADATDIYFYGTLAVPDPME